jgi:hypothetical protein
MNSAISLQKNKIHQSSYNNDVNLHLVTGLTPEICVKELAQTL